MLPIPAIIAIVVLATGGTTVVVANTLRTKEKNIAVFGPEKSGKSEFIHILKYGKWSGKPYAATKNGKIERTFHAFWTIGNVERYLITVNKTDKVASKIEWCNRAFWRKTDGMDISGDNNDLYEDIIDHSESIFFLFDISRFIQEPEYFDECLGRIGYIFEYSKKINKSNQIFFLGTHCDKVHENIDNIKKELRSKQLRGQYFCESFINHLELLNLQSRSAGEEIQRLFSK